MVLALHSPIHYSWFDWSANRDRLTQGDANTLKWFLASVSVPRWVLLATAIAIIIAGLASADTEYTTTSNFDAGTKSQPTPVDGNYGVETLTDNPGIAANQLELTSIKGDSFTLGDASGGTFKWNVLQASGTCDTFTIASGVFYMNVSVAVATACYATSHSTVSGVLDISVKTSSPMDGTNRQEYLMLANTANPVDAGVDGLQYRILVDTTLAAFTLTNNVATQVGTNTVLAATDPIWLRITRSGTRVNYFYSTDGSVWIFDETVVFTTSSSLYANLLAVNNGVADGVITFDDFDVRSGIPDSNGYRTTGNWTSGIYNLSSGWQVSQVILSHESLTAEYVIDFVRLYSNGSLIEEWTNDIESGTITVLNATATVQWNVTIAVGLKGVGSNTPVLTAIKIAITATTTAVISMDAISMAIVLGLLVFFWASGLFGLRFLPLYTVLAGGLATSLSIYVFILDTSLSLLVFIPLIGVSVFVLAIGISELLQ